MAKNDSAKGNPAHKRISNSHRKAYRQALWAKQQRRKELRRRAQAEAAARNKANGFTLWEMARRNRSA